MTIETDDRAAITNLIARLAHIIDIGDLEDFSEIYAPDASWETATTMQRGLPEIITGSSDRRRSGSTGPGSASLHVISTTEIDFERAGVARTVSYWIIYENTRTQPTIRAMGIYEDNLERRQDGWRIVRRRVTIN